MPKRNATENIASSAAKTAYILYGGQIFAIIISLATFVALARLLGPGSYGLYAFAISFAAIIGGFRNFGIGAYLSKEISKNLHSNDVDGISRAISSGLALLFVLAFILTLIGLGLSGVVANVLFGSIGISVLSLILASMTIFFMMFQNAAIMGLIGISRPKAAAVATILIDTVQLISILLLLHYGFGVNGALFGMLIGYIVGAVIATAYLVRVASTHAGFRIYIPSKKELKHAFSFAAPIGAVNMLNQVMQNASVLILGLFVSAEILGNYGAALKGLAFTSVITTTLSSILIPVFSKVAAGKSDAASRDATYDKVVRYSLMLTLPILIYIGVMANPGVHILLSNKYAYAPLYLTLISFGIAISLVSISIGSLIISRGVTRRYLYYSAITSAIELISAVVLVPYFKVVGVIVAVFVIGSIVSNALFIKLSREKLKAKLNYGKIYLLLLSNFILAVPMYAALLVPNYAAELVAGIVILLIAYPAILAFLRLVDKKDLDRIANSTSKIMYLSSAVDYFCRYTKFFVERIGAADA